MLHVLHTPKAEQRFTPTSKDHRLSVFDIRISMNAQYEGYEKIDVGQSSYDDGQDFERQGLRPEPPLRIVVDRARKSPIHGK